MYQVANIYLITRGQAIWRNHFFPHRNLCHRFGSRTSGDMYTKSSVYGFTMYAVFMSEVLSQHDIKLLDGQESFCGPGIKHPLQLIDYWRWSGSELMNNTTRGILAEFLVAAALGLHKEPREEWKEYDLCTKSRHHN